MSVSSFNKIRRAHVRLIRFLLKIIHVPIQSGLPLCTNKLCSLLFVVVVHAVINRPIASPMRRQLCGKLHGGFSHLLFARPAHHRLIGSYIADDRDLCSLHLRSTLPLGGPCRNVAMMFGMEKLEWFGYPIAKKFRRCFYSFC